MQVPRRDPAVVEATGLAVGFAVGVVWTPVETCGVDDAVQGNSRETANDVPLSVHTRIVLLRLRCNGHATFSTDRQGAYQTYRVTCKHSFRNAKRIWVGGYQDSN